MRNVSLSIKVVRNKSLRSSSAALDMCKYDSMVRAVTELHCDFSISAVVDHMANTWSRDQVIEYLAHLACAFHGTQDRPMNGAA